MNRKDFYELFGEFFQKEDVQKLEEYALNFFLEQIQIGEIGFDEMEEATGHPIPEEARNQMEWRF